MIRRALSPILLAAVLAGCSNLASWQPYAVEIASPAVYAADKASCLTYAQGYSPGLDFSGLGSAAIKGGAQNAPAGVVGGPLIPAVGALGSATTQVLNDLDLLSTDKKRVFVICLREKTRRDRAALVLDPN